MEPTTQTAPTRRPVLDQTFAAVLFDMDGTLISSTAAVERSWNRWVEELALPAGRFPGFAGLHGMPARDLVDLLLSDRDADERARALERITAIELEDTAGIAVLPGAAEALGALAPHGRCAIVTSCGRDLAAARLAATGLPVPGTVVTVDDVLAGKPDPEPFVTGAARLGVAVEDCLVVEDAAAGVRAARAAGAATLVLRTTDADGHPDADLVVPDLSAVHLTVVDGRVHVRAA